MSVNLAIRYEAVSTLRNPTQAMLNAGHGQAGDVYGLDDKTLRRIYRAMIDEKLQALESRFNKKRK